MLCCAVQSLDGFKSIDTKEINVSRCGGSRDPNRCCVASVHVRAA
jgi:hypothetical protein